VALVHIIKEVEDDVEMMPARHITQVCLLDTSPKYAPTKLIIHHTDTLRENADFQQTMSNKCWQLLATCCNGPVRVLPEPHELLRPIWANFG